MRALAAALLCGCGPQVQLAECAVLCDTVGLCPSGMACGVDGFCHAPGQGRSCLPDASSADAPPARLFTGTVSDALSREPVAGAWVTALTAEGWAASRRVAADQEGAYTLAVQTTEDRFTLRVDAPGYLPFPSGIRRPVPIPTASGPGLPDLLLQPLEDTFPAATVRGLVEVAPDRPGALVVVTVQTAAFVGVADRDGAYVVTNVPAAADAVVAAYAAGAEYTSVRRDLQGDTQVDLVRAGEATASVTGTATIVNAATPAQAGVQLVVAPPAAPGQSFPPVQATPPGLRAPVVGDDFTLAGVPPGAWIVLAAEATDGLVVDPDPTIASTNVPLVTVQGDTVASADGIKITGALELLEPADGAEVSSSPTFRWRDDASEDEWEVDLWDATGTLVASANLPSMGAGEIAYTFDAGTMLRRGAFYAVRIRSLRDNEPFSSTETSLGLFRVAP